MNTVIASTTNYRHCEEQRDAATSQIQLVIASPKLTVIASDSAAISQIQLVIASEARQSLKWKHHD